MRLLTLAIAVVIMLLPGCRSSGTVVVNTPDPYAAFSALPRPSELSAQHAASSEAPAKAVSNLVLMEGASYTDDPPSSNVSRVGSEVWLYAETQELTYAFFMLANTELQSTESFTHVRLEYDWETGYPEAPHGLYLGLPDYASDTWFWQGPLAQEEEWLDISDRNLVGTLGPEYFVVVAFAPTNSLVEVEQVALRHTNINDPIGDEWLYYAHKDPAEPTFGSSISRARPDGSEIDHLFVGGETSDNISPQIVTSSPRRLAFAHADSGRYEIWRSELDGSDPTTLMSVEDTDVVPVGWHPTRESFLFLRREGMALWWDLWARDIDAGVNGLVHAESEIIREAVWDITSEYRFSALAVTGNPDSEINYIRSDGPLPLDNSFEFVMANVEGNYHHEPDVYTISDGLGGKRMGLIVSYQTATDCSLSIHHGAIEDFNGFSTYLNSTEYDLRSPAVSPDGTRIAIVRCDKGEALGTLVVTDFLAPDLATAVEIAEDVAGDVIWYDPGF